MKKNFIYILSVFVILIFTESCIKDQDEFIATSKTTILTPIGKPDSVWELEDTLINPNIPGFTFPLFDIEKLNKKLNLETKKDTLLAEEGGIINSGDEAYIEIPPFCCIGSNNEPCKGKIEIEHIILRTKGEILSFDKPTVSGGKLLISGGVVYVIARQNGKELRLAPNKTIKAHYKMSKIETGMSLFEGKSVNRFQYNWVQLSSSLTRNVVTTWADSTQERKGYQLLIDRFGWINCDKFNDEPNLTNKVCVALPDSFTNRNTSVYLVFNDINSIVKLEGNTTLRQFCIPSSYKGVPIGRNITILAIANIDERYYIATQNITIAPTIITRLSPQKISLEDLKTKILSL